MASLQRLSHTTQSMQLKSPCINLLMKVHFLQHHSSCFNSGASSGLDAVASSASLGFAAELSSESLGLLS
jgi:hypothetical protein